MPERERGRLIALFERGPLIAEAWGRRSGSCGGGSAGCPCSGTCLRAEQCGRDDADPVSAPVGLPAGGDHDRVKEVLADGVPKPFQVSGVRIVGVAGELDLDRYHSSAGPFDDQVDLVLAAAGTQVKHAGLGRLGIGAHGQRDERFEEGAYERSVAGDPWADLGAAEQRPGINAEESCGEGGIREMVLGGQRQATNVAARRSPGRTGSRTHRRSSTARYGRVAFFEGFSPRPR